MIKPQDWADWLQHPVTQAVILHLEEKKDATLHGLLNADISQHSAEQLGLVHLMYRSKLDGMGEFLELESLGDSLLEGNQ